MPDVITLHASDSRSTAKIAPGFGFNAFSFQADCDGRLVDVLDADPAFPAPELRPSGHGIPLLFPYPNRIRGGRYLWDGQEYHLPEGQVLYDRTGNAIHGFCVDRPWRVISVGTDFVTAEFQLSRDAPERRHLWPADFRLTATYRLRGATLGFGLTIDNPEGVPLPWGFGTHAYFRVPLDAASRVGGCLIQVPVSTQWQLDACLPSGETRRLPAELAELPVGEYLDVLKLDDVFTGVAGDSDGWTRTIVMDEQAGLQVEQRFGPEFEHIVLFTPPNRSAVCIEPYTCVTDAVHLPAEISGWRVLPPGECCRLAIDLTVSPVIA